MTIESRVPFADYQAMPGMNITRLKELRRSPQHFIHNIEHPKQSDALTLGSAAHCATLEPERFERQYCVWTRRTDGGRSAPRNGQYYDSFLRQNAGKQVLTVDEAAEATAIAEAVRADPVARQYLDRGDPEVTMQWTALGRSRKGRIDWLTSIDDTPVLVGLKTTRDCRLFQFGAQAARLAYHLQWAWYFDGFKAITGKTPKVIEIVVENEAPHAVMVYRITGDIIAQGRDEYEDLLATLDACEKSNLWLGPSAGMEHELSLPSWVYGTQSDDLTEIGLEVA